MSIWIINLGISKTCITGVVQKFKKLHMEVFVIKQCTRFFRSLVTSVSELGQRSLSWS